MTEQMSIYKQWIIAIVLGLGLFSMLSTCVDSILSEAHQQMCDDGTLVDRLCVTEPSVQTEQTEQPERN